MKEAVKQKLLYLFKVLFGAGIVICILVNVDQQKFVDYFQSLSFETLVVLLLLTSCSLIIQFNRWKYLVQSNSTHFNFKDLLPSFFAGFAFRLMIPGGHAEFSKIFLLPGKKRGKAVAFGMEKFFQIFIKIVLIIAVLPISFPQYKIYCIGLLILLFGAYLFFPKIPFLKILQEKKVNNYKIFAITLVFSLSIYAIMALQYFLLLNQVSSISILTTMHTVVYLWGAGIVPISISGLGIREGLAVYFLNMYNIPAAHAVATSLFLFTLCTIFPALIGSYFIYKKRSYLKEIKNSVQSTKEMFNNLRNGKQSA